VAIQIHAVLKVSDVDPNAVLMDWKCPRCKSVVEINVKQMGLSST